MNICYCETEAGYLHKPDCPYPLYRATEAEEIKWYAARAELFAKQNPDEPEAFCPLCDAGVGYCNGHPHGNNDIPF